MLVCQWVWWGVVVADFLALGVCEAVFGFGTVIVLLIDAGGICLATTKKEWRHIGKIAQQIMRFASSSDKISSISA